MPISKENLARYPKNWKTEVVPRIRARSGNRCECLGECGRIHNRRQELVTGEEPPRCHQINGAPINGIDGAKVVLTVAHLNHQPEDCRDEVLRHMCQRCHLRYDRTHHQINARATRDRKAGQERMDV